MPGSVKVWESWRGAYGDWWPVGYGVGVLARQGGGPGFSANVTMTNNIPSGHTRAAVVESGSQLTMTATLWHGNAAN